MKNDVWQAIKSEIFFLYQWDTKRLLETRPEKSGEETGFEERYFSEHQAP